MFYVFMKWCKQVINQWYPKCSICTPEVVQTVLGMKRESRLNFSHRPHSTCLGRLLQCGGLNSGILEVLLTSVYCTLFCIISVPLFPLISDQGHSSPESSNHSEHCHCHFSSLWLNSVSEWMSSEWENSPWKVRRRWQHILCESRNDQCSISDTCLKIVSGLLIPKLRLY